MLYIFAVVLIILWLLGIVSSYTMSGFIHILLVIAIVLVLVRIISGKKPLYNPALPSSLPLRYLRFLL